MACMKESMSDNLSSTRKPITYFTACVNPPRNATPKKNSLFRKFFGVRRLDISKYSLLSPYEIWLVFLDVKDILKFFEIK